VDQGTTQRTLGASYSTYQADRAVEQYDEGISEDRRWVDIDTLEEARCATLIQSARYLEGIRQNHDRNVKEHSFTSAT
jgi:hypothetical protein